MSSEKEQYRLPTLEANELHTEMLQLRSMVHVLKQLIDECPEAEREANGLSTRLGNVQMVADLTLPLAVSVLRRFEEITEKSELA